MILRGKNQNNSFQRHILTFQKILHLFFLKKKSFLLKEKYIYSGGQGIDTALLFTDMSATIRFFLRLPLIRPIYIYGARLKLWRFQGTHETPGSGEIDHIDFYSFKVSYIYDALCYMYIYSK